MSRLFHLPGPPVRLLEVTGSGLAPVRMAQMDREKRLEDWLEADLSPLGLDAMPIGRQVETPFGGRVDLLAISREGDLLVVEIKRDRTPRSSVAQALDYASWVCTLDAAGASDIYRLFRSRDLAEDFHRRFGVPLPPEVNERHRLILLAAEIDEATRRIVTYLACHSRIDVNAASFHLYRFGDRELVAIDWLVDPAGEASGDARAARNGEGLWFVNVGIDPNADWEDNRRHGYIGARGGAAYGRRFSHLKIGDWFFAYRRGPGDQRGYVGFGAAIGPAVEASRAVLGGTPFLALGIDDRFFRAETGADDGAAVVMPVRWIKTVPETEARRFRGIFANQQVVCRLTDLPTLDFLKREFGG